MLLKKRFWYLFRLHEFDDQVAAVREGMSKVVPVPLLSLFTGSELETMVILFAITKTHLIILLKFHWNSEDLDCFLIINIYLILSF